VPLLSNDFSGKDRLALRPAKGEMLGFASTLAPKNVPDREGLWFIKYHPSSCYLFGSTPTRLSARADEWDSIGCGDLPMSEKNSPSNPLRGSTIHQTSGTGSFSGANALFPLVSCRRERFLHSRFSLGCRLLAGAALESTRLQR